jgi:hypothetical protein
MPPEMVEGMSSDPMMQAVAPTMPYDFEVMGDFGGGAIPEDLVRAVSIPTLVIAGGASPDFLSGHRHPDRGVPAARKPHRSGGSDHGAPADVVAPVVAVGRRCIDASRPAGHSLWELGVPVRIVIELDTADGRATVTTEPHLQGVDLPPVTPTGVLGVADATDAGPPAEGTPLTGQAAAASGEAVEAGPAPSAGGAGAVAGSEEGGGGGRPVDAGGARDLG